MLYRLSINIHDVQTDATVDQLVGGIIDGLKQPGDPTKPMVEQGQELFPVALGIFGSGFALVKVNNVIMSYQVNVNSNNMKFSCISI